MKRIKDGEDLSEAVEGTLQRRANSVAHLVEMTLPGSHEDHRWRL